MKLNKITLKNFRSFGPQEIEFDLNDYNGLNLITGINGVGKSTLFDSIIYTFYGKVRDEKIEDIVNRQINKNCKTAVEFNINEDVFKIFRYRNHDQHKNNIYVFKNDKDISLKNASDTQQLINDIIRIPYTGFVNSTFFSSETYKPFLRAKNSERLNIFENLLSLKEVNLLYDVARKHNVKLNEEISEVNNVKNIIENEISSLNETIIEYKKNAKIKLVSFKKEKDDLEKSIEADKAKLEDYKSLNIEEEKEKLKKINEVDLIKKQIVKLESEIKKIEELNYNVRKNAQWLKELDWEKEFSKNNRKKELQSKIDESKTSINNLRNQTTNIGKDIYNSGQEEEKILKEIKSLKLELEDILKEICPRCHQHIQNSTQEKEGIEKRLEELRKKYIDQENDTKHFSEELKKAENVLKELESNIDSYNDELKHMYLFFEDAEKQKIECERASEKVIAYEKEKKLIDEFNEKIYEKIKELKSKIDNTASSNYTEEELSSIEDRINRLTIYILNSEKRISEINGSVGSVYDKNYISSIEDRINAKTKNLEETIQQIESLKDDNKYYAFICECFSNKANSFKKYYIGEMIDMFNNKINQFLPFFFTDNISISFDKDLNEIILNGKDEITFSSLSTGQKQRCELAISFALFNTARVFFANDANVLILDEILDQGLDISGIRSAITILEGLEKDNKIFIVSHNPNLQDLIENVVKIKQDENKMSVIVH